jgi:hypothetical protein
MALGKNDNYTGGNLIILTLLTRDANKQDIPATFQVKRKNEEGDWVADKETFSYVKGDLFRLETYINEWVDEKTKKKMVAKGFKVMLRDQEAGDIYLLDCKLNMLTRGLLNKILALTSFKGVTLGVFRGNNGMNNNYVKVGNEKVGWKFDKAVLPVPVEIKHPMTDEVLQRDYTKLDKFFLEAAEEFALQNNLVKNAVVKTAVKEEVEGDDEVNEKIAAEVAEIVDEVDKFVGAEEMEDSPY